MVDVPVTSAAAFARQGSILPLHVSTPLLHNGDADSADSYTFVIHSPDLSGNTVEQEVRRPKGHGFTISYQAVQSDMGLILVFNVTAVDENIIILIRGMPDTIKAGQFAIIQAQTSLD